MKVLLLNSEYDNCILYYLLQEEFIELFDFINLRAVSDIKLVKLVLLVFLWFNCNHGQKLCGQLRKIAL